jgi:hypothetical protein
MRQLTAAWSEDGKHAVISRGDEVLVKHPVTFSGRTHSWLKPGNGKLAHYGSSGIGVLNFVRNGCMRGYAGVERAEDSCYSDGPGTGCFAGLTTHAAIRKNSGFSIVANGVAPGTEKFFVLTLPRNGNLDLSMFPQKVWRVDSESSSSCLSLALGLTQRVAEANPDKVITGISSDYFFVPDAQLRRAAACKGITIGHSLSPWFGISDIRNRIAAARRFEGHGVTTTLWIITRPEWEAANPEGWRLIMEEVGRYDPRAVIFLGYHDRSVHETATADLNPMGVCCRNGIDKVGRYVDMETRLTLDGGEEATGACSGTCHRCALGCGAAWLKISQAA